MKIIKEYNTFRKRTNYTKDEWFKAVNTNDRHRVSMMLADGFDVNTQSSHLDTALHIAAYNNAFKLAEILFCQRELNVNIQNENGDTPLMLAALYHCHEIFKLLLKHPDIDLTIRDNAGDNFIDKSNYLSLLDYDVQLEILKKAPVLYKSYKQKGITIDERILKQFPHLTTGNELNLL